MNHLLEILLAVAAVGVVVFCFTTDVLLYVLVLPVMLVVAAILHLDKLWLDWRLSKSPGKAPSPPRVLQLSETPKKIVAVVVNIIDWVATGVLLTALLLLLGSGWLFRDSHYSWTTIGVVAVVVSAAGYWFSGGQHNLCIKLGLIKSYPVNLNIADLKRAEDAFKNSVWNTPVKPWRECIEADFPLVGKVRKGLLGGRDKSPKHEPQERK